MTREQLAVPRAEFRSYYGRQVLKSPAWNWMIAAYLFSGGLSAGSAMLAAGADLTGRPGLRRVSRVGSLASILASLYFLVADLGRPERFHHMLRVAKPSSPMSMGTWILSAYGPGAGLAGVAELMPSPLRRTWLGRLMGWLARPAGLWAAGRRRGSHRIPQFCCRRPRFRRGMRRTRICRLCSLARRRRAGEAGACFLRRSVRPPRRGGWPWLARVWRWRRRGSWSSGWVCRRRHTRRERRTDCGNGRST